MTVHYTPEQIREKYDEFASQYDLFEGTADWLAGLPLLRRPLFRQAGSPLLEVGVGTGKTLRHWRGLESVTVTDLSGEMLKRARLRAGRLGMTGLRALLADTEHLPFADSSFATVVSSQTLCTTPDPVAALREMGRVCRPEGRILLMEHGPSSFGPLDRWIERREERVAERLACHPHRDHAALVREAGLKLLELRRSHLGVFYRIMAAPAS